MTESKESFTFKGVLKGHNGWVTCLASPGSNNEMLVSGSRDKTLIVWELTREQNSYGYAKKSLQGHGHFISDVDLSKDGQYALSGSWDKTLRLWDLSTGQSTKTFVGHEKDVLSVAFSDDNRQIVSGSRDRTIKLWNILGEMKYELRGHTDWVSSVAFSANADKPAIVSGGWDRVVKVWEQKSFKLDTNLIGHTAFINVVTVSPDGSLCASGGKDGTAMLWDLSKGNHLYSLNAGECVNALKFSPSRYWLCAATNNSIKIWDLETKESVAELIPEKDPKSKKRPSCVSLAWSADGTTLFSGYTDGVIRVWGVSGV